MVTVAGWSMLKLPASVEIFFRISRWRHSTTSLPNGYQWPYLSLEPLTNVRHNHISMIWEPVDLPTAWFCSSCTWVPFCFPAVGIVAVGQFGEFVLGPPGVHIFPGNYPCGFNNKKWGDVNRWGRSETYNGDVVLKASRLDKYSEMAQQRGTRQLVDFCFLGVQSFWSIESTFLSKKVQDLISKCFCFQKQTPRFFREASHTFGKSDEWWVMGI